MQKIEKPQKPLLFYYFAVLVVMILLNTLLFPDRKSTRLNSSHAL